MSCSTFNCTAKATHNFAYATPMRRYCGLHKTPEMKHYNHCQISDCTHTSVAKGKVGGLEQKVCRYHLSKAEKIQKISSPCCAISGCFVLTNKDTCKKHTVLRKRKETDEMEQKAKKARIELQKKKSIARIAAKKQAILDDAKREKDERSAYLRNLLKNGPMKFF